MDIRISEAMCGSCARGAISVIRVVQRCALARLCVLKCRGRAETLSRAGGAIVPCGPDRAAAGRVERTTRGRCGLLSRNAELPAMQCFGNVYPARARLAGFLACLFLDACIPAGEPPPSDGPGQATTDGSANAGGDDGVTATSGNADSSNSAQQDGSTDASDDADAQDASV